MMNRRKFLLALSAMGGVGALSLAHLNSKLNLNLSPNEINSLSLNSSLNLNKGKAEEAKPSWLISACSDKKGNFFVAAFNLQGQIISKVALPARGHDVLAIKSKPGHALVFARRPGNFVLEVDFSRGEQGVIVQQIEVSSNQHFYGHGVLVDNDNVLVSTENDYERGKGLIVLRDRHTQKVIEQYDSGGIGPHEIALMPNISVSESMLNSALNSLDSPRTTSAGERIVIANGGIKTHPSQSRKKLNLSTMQPNLAYMELNSGKIVDKYVLENKQLSIRHLDVSAQGKVIAGLQYQGAYTDDVPLVVSHQGEEQLQFLEASNDIWRRLKHYTASVCINSTENYVAITCPKANLLTYWQLDNNQFIASHKLKDNAGLAVVENSIITSTGRGRITRQMNPKINYEIKADFKDFRWDNHMTAIESV
jgi:hypothetical protein